jgi:hypothetical protein
VTTGQVKKKTIQIRVTKPTNRDKNPEKKVGVHIPIRFDSPIL